MQNLPKYLSANEIDCHSKWAELPFMRHKCKMHAINYQLFNTLLLRRNNNIENDFTHNTEFNACISCLNTTIIAFSTQQLTVERCKTHGEQPKSEQTDNFERAFCYSSVIFRLVNQSRIHDGIFRMNILLGRLMRSGKIAKFHRRFKYTLLRRDDSGTGRKILS